MVVVYKGNRSMNTWSDTKCLFAGIAYIITFAALFFGSTALVFLAGPR